MKTVMHGITFDSDFPGGNGRLLDLTVHADGLDMEIMAEPKRCPQPLWFHFRLHGIAGRPVRMTLANADVCLGNPEGWAQNRIVYKIKDRPWERTEPGKLLRQPGAPIQVTFEAPGGATEMELAFCYPYQPTDFQRLLPEAGYSVEATLGYSDAGRPVQRFATQVKENKNLPGIYVLARQHSGETPGSWVMEGMLRRLAKSADLYGAAAWWFVPFVNIDGVEEGSYGKNPWPHDRNRSWQTPCPVPEVYAIAKDVNRWQHLFAPALFLDLHAPSHPERNTYFFAPKNVKPEIKEKARRLHDLFADRLPEPLKGEKTWRERTTRPPPASQPEPAPNQASGVTASRFGCTIEGCLGITLETTYQGTSKYPFTIPDYLSIGETMAESIVLWLKETHEYKEG